MDNEFDEWIHEAVTENFPELLDDLGEDAWLIVKAQIKQESGFKPNATSPAGALGLMQIMPDTAQWLGMDDPFDPLQSIRFGITYLAMQYERLTEITSPTDRIRAALAAYNGGRGYINKCMSLGRKMCGHPEGYSEWREQGSPGGVWQTWAVISHLLQSPYCVHKGLVPDHQQMIHYVSNIMRYFPTYLEKG